MKLLRYALLLLAIALSVSVYAQTTSTIKDKSTGNAVTASSSLDFTFGDSFADRFEVSGNDGEKNLTIADFKLLLLDEDGNIKGFMDADAAMNGDNIDPDTKYRFALQSSDGTYFPGVSGFGVNVKKRVLTIDGAAYFEAYKQYDGEPTVNVDLEYANEHLTGALKEDNIKVTFEANYYGTTGRLDSKVGTDKTIRFTNIKVYGKNVKGYEFKLEDKVGGITKNTVAAEKVYWKYNSKVVKSAVTIPYGATLGTGADFFSDIDKLEGITTNYNPYPTYYYYNVEDPANVITFTSSSDPLMLPVGTYIVKSKFTVLSNKTAYYDDVYSNEITLNVKESVVKVIPVDAVPEYNYGESALGIDINFKGVSESGSNMPGTWKYMTEDSVWYEYGKMLPVGSYTLQAVFQPGNNNFTSKPSVLVSFEVKPRVLTVDATTPFVQDTKPYDTTTAVLGIDVAAANSTLATVVETNGVEDEVYIESIDAQYVGPDVNTDNQHIVAKFTLGGAMAANYIVEDMDIPGEITPLKIRTVLNGGEFDYGEANLYEGSLKPYFVFDSDPSKRVEYPVESEAGSKWVVKSETSAQFVKEVPNGYYNTGVVPVHLDACTHKIYACFQTSENSNYEVVNNYVDEDGDPHGTDLTTIKVNPVKLDVWYGDPVFEVTKKITKVKDGNISLYPSDIDVVYAHGYNYRYTEDSTVFVVDGFNERNADLDTISCYDTPEIASGKLVKVEWTFAHGDRIAMNYYSNEEYKNGRITRKLKPGEPDYVFEWSYQDKESYPETGSMITMSYGAKIGTVRPIGDERENYDLYSDFVLFNSTTSVFSHLPVYKYKKFGSSDEYQTYTDGTVIPVGKYIFKAEFKSTDTDVWEDVVTDIVVEITPLELTPVVKYETVKYYDGNTKVKVNEYYLEGLLDEHKDKVKINASILESISYSDFNVGNRPITWSAAIDFADDTESCYKVTKTSDTDASGKILGIEPQIVWYYKGKEVSGSVEVSYLEIFKKDLYASVKFADDALATIAKGHYSDLQYTTLLGTLSSDNKFLMGNYAFKALTVSDDSKNFANAESEISVTVVPETIELAPTFEPATYKYGSKIGTDFKFVASNDAEVLKYSDVVITYRLGDEVVPLGYAPQPGTYQVSASAYDKKGILLKGFSNPVTITIGAAEAEIVPSQDKVVTGEGKDIYIKTVKDYDGNNSTTVVSHKFTVKKLNEDDDVEVEIVANYDNEKAGTGKNIYYTVSLTGDDAAMYAVPDSWKKVLYTKEGIINPLTPVVAMDNYTVTYGESYFGTNITARVEPSLKGTWTYYADGEAIDVKTPLEVKIDGGKVSPYLVSATFKPEDTNYEEATIDFIEVVVNPKTVSLTGELLIADKYYDKTSLIDIENQVTDAELNVDEILAADKDNVSLKADYTKTKYPYEAAGEYRGIPVTYSLTGDKANNYKLANSGSANTLTLTADSKIIGFTLEIDVEEDPENPGGGSSDPSNPGGGTSDPEDPSTKVEYDENGIAIFTRVYGSSRIGQDIKVSEKVLTAGMSVDYKIDGADVDGKMLLPKFDSDGQAVPYVVNIDVYQNGIVVDQQVIKVKVLKRQLKVDELNFSHTKEWDGTTLPSSFDTGRLKNVVGSDGIFISVTTIRFDTPDLGSDKTITAKFTIDGSSCPDWEDRYIAPEDFVYTDGEITRAKIKVDNIKVSGEAFCSGDDILVTFDIITAGSPSMYSITFSSDDVALGFKNVVKGDLPSTAKTQTVTFAVPGGVSYGKHTVQIQLFDEVGSEGEVTDFTFTTGLNNSIIHDKFTDVVLIDNSSYDYVAYEWNKDGSTISGANNQFYNDKPYLYGWYGAIVTTTSGEKIKVCPAYFDHRPVGGKSAAKTVGVYPNPAFRMETVTIDLSDFEGDDLSNAVIIIYNSVGNMAKKITDVQVKNFVNLPTDNYTGIVVFGDNKLSFKLIVRD